MNNKGFTLVELLAVIVLISLILGIATYGVTNAINNSKLKSEEVFIDKISSLIDDYIDYVNLNSNVNFSMEKIKTDNPDNPDNYTFSKCDAYKKNETGNTVCRTDEESRSVELYQVKIDNKDNNVCRDDNDVCLNSLLVANLISNDEFINPKTRNKCKDLDNTPIYIFRDSEFVYYYYIDLKTSCGIEEREENDEFGIINTLPDLIPENDYSIIIPNYKNELDETTDNA